MAIEAIKKKYPINDENGQPSTYPTFASQVFFNDGTVLEGKEFGGGTASDSEKLGGKAPEYYLYHRVLVARGRIVNCGSDPITGHGIATVLLLPNGIAMIYYAMRITTAGTTSNMYEWGINRDLLRAINANIPVITPIEGGYCTYTQSGSHKEDLEGYGGTYQVDDGSNFWRFARVYNTSGNIGAWSTKELGAGCYANGVCFGTYERT